MGGRWYTSAVIACWLATMSWLLLEKVLPTITAGDQPDFQTAFPVQPDEPQVVCWDIRYEERSIGRAVTQAVRNPDETGRLDSVVQFEQLPLDEILSELMGAVGAWIRPMWQANRDVLVEFTVASRLLVQADGRLDRFTTRVSLAGLPDFIRVEGRAEGNLLKLEVLTPKSDGSAGAMDVRYRDEYELPRDALVSGGFTPHPRLANLRIGQSWTLPVYRPFPPGNSVQMLEARVERHELFSWNGELERAHQVVLRDDAGSGISVAREPVGRMWVRDDGAVLQQEARMANLRFRFVRSSDEACSENDHLLDAWIDD